MKKILVVTLVLLIGMIAGVGSAQAADSGKEPFYTFIVIENKPMGVTLADGSQKVFNPFELVKKALMDEYSNRVSVVEGKGGTPGAIVIEPRKIEVWKRGGMVKEGIFAALVNGQFVEAQFGELEGSLDAGDVETKVLAAMKGFAKKMRVFAP